MLVLTDQSRFAVPECGAESTTPADRLAGGMAEHAPTLAPVAFVPGLSFPEPADPMRRALLAEAIGTLEPWARKRIQL